MKVDTSLNLALFSCPVAFLQDSKVFQCVCMADSTREESYQCGTVRDPTAALHTFQCCHPSRSHDHFQGGRKKYQCIPPGWSQHSALKRVILCLPSMRRNYIPLAQGVKSLPWITGCYQSTRGNSRQIMLLFS